MIDLEQSGAKYVDPELSLRLYNINIFSSNVDQAIDLIRQKYNIVVYNSAAPHVSSTNKENKIVFGYTVKKCYPGTPQGWNKRVYIYTTNWYDDPWKAKIEAIKAIVEYVETRPINNLVGKCVPYY